MDIQNLIYLDRQQSVASLQRQHSPAVSMARGLAHDANAVRRQPENLRTRDLIGYITIYIYIYIYILPANDLVRCGHTLENHTPMS